MNKEIIEIMSERLDVDNNLNARVARIESWLKLAPLASVPTKAATVEDAFTKEAPTGLRTERVTLEITHSESSSAASWAWGNWTIPGQSVRVVEEELSDRWAQRLARITDERETLRSRIDKIERAHNEANGCELNLEDVVASLTAELDAAIRERDRIRENAKAEHNIAKAALDERDAAIRERDALKDRVADLESQLEFVADRAAAAETALESAPAASEWRILALGEIVRDGDEYLQSDGRWVEVALRHEIREQDVGRFRRRVPRPAASGNSQAILDGSPAASGAAGTEVVAWAVMVHRDAAVLCVPFTVREAADHFVRLNGVNEMMSVVPLYSAPQPAKGWMTEEQREAVQAVILSAGKTVICKDCCRSLHQAQTILRQLEVVRSILARSTDAEPKGWLTPEEREAIIYLIANRSQFAPQTPHEERRNAASRVCHALLARSTPPVVVLGECPFTPDSTMRWAFGRLLAR